MYGKIREFKQYTLWQLVLVIGLSTFLFVIGGIFLGYIAELYSHINHLADWIPPKFIVTEWFIYHLHFNWFEALMLTGFIGIVFMVAGLIGYVSISRWIIFELLKRKR